ncbi:MAG TPA: hypothetical protein DCL77_03290 [Prolixibacteraceae bacterium]|jgi:hypothetical protein|nr:hypothetical protein [Prolixibacteraceae bacterium]
MNEILIRQISIIGVSVLNLSITGSYCWLTYKQKIKPALAMWIFFTIAVAISLATYLQSDHFSLLDNILNTTDLALAVAVSIAIYFFGDHTTRFTRFDKGCLVAVLVILLFWFITKNHVITHGLTQGILVIAYFPVVRRLWKTRENGESFLVWGGMLVAPMLSMLSSKGLLATIYSVRAIVCILVLMLLMLRVEYLAKKQATKF